MARNRPRQKRLSASTLRRDATSNDHVAAWDSILDQGFIIHPPRRFQPLSELKAGGSPPPLVVKAARVLDVSKGVYIENAAVWIEGERVKEVGPAPLSVS